MGGAQSITSLFLLKNGIPRMSVGSICPRRKSIMCPPKSSVMPAINSDLPIPGGPHKNTGRLFLNARSTRLRHSFGVTLRFSVTDITYSLKNVFVTNTKSSLLKMSFTVKLKYDF